MHARTTSEAIPCQFDGGDNMAEIEMGTNQRGVDDVDDVWRQNRMNVAIGSNYHCLIGCCWSALTSDGSDNHYNET